MRDLPIPDRGKMSVDYASGLSPYENKGECGMKEHFDSETEVEEKVKTLAGWIKEGGGLVVITGAGISTSAGIPDFRGPKGVWTLEQKGVKPVFDVTFDSARPTLTHMALVALEEKNILTHVISQNVDGLHLRSGFPRKAMSELHGNMFVEECDRCNAQYIRSQTVPTMAQRYTGNNCSQRKARGSICRGRLRDTILDWEGSLPDMDLTMADNACRKNKVCLTLGTSLQILPCGNMPLLTKKMGGKFCVVNLQPTKHDKKCHMKIHCYVDKVMELLCKELGVEIKQWQRPVVHIESSHPRNLDIKFPSYIVDECLLPVKNEELKNETGRVCLISTEKLQCKSEIKACDSKLDDIDSKDQSTGINKMIKSNQTVTKEEGDNICEESNMFVNGSSGSQSSNTVENGFNRIDSVNMDEPQTKHPKLMINNE